MTKEEFVRDLKAALANPEGRAKYDAVELEFSRLIEQVRQFDPILCEHMEELHRVATNMEKYLLMVYK